MLILLSPAKTLDFAPAPPELSATRPRLADEAQALAAAARRLTRPKIRALMGISPRLADLNHARFQALEPANDCVGLQAVLAFAGDVYAGLSARELDGDALAWAQERLRILSGLYGVLRPLDRIQPYRLEMGVRLKTRRGATLYDFWGERISRLLNDDARGHADPTVVNLASQEYFGAVDRNALDSPVVSIRFLEEKDGDARIVSFFAKKARGLMARWAIDHRVERAADLKRFDGGGYAFRPSMSTADEWTFTRPQP